MTGLPERRRRQLAVALVVLTALLLAGAAVSWYLRSAIVDEREFSARATAALDDPDLRIVVADRVVGALTRTVAPDALAIRPIVVPVVASLADTARFRALFARVIRARHRALVSGETTFSLELPIGEGLVFDALDRVVPRVAARIPRDLNVPVVRLDPRDFELDAARVIDDVAGWRWPLLVAALLAATGCAVLAGGLRRALAYVGIAVTGAGLIVAALVAGLGEFVVSHAAHAADLSDERERGAVRGLWMGLFSDLLMAGLVAALGGAVVAALAVRGAPAVDPVAGWRWARRTASSPEPAARFGRAALLIVVGAALVVEPALLGRVLVVAGGVLVVLVGISQLAGEGTPVPGAGKPGGASPVLLAGVMAGVLAVTALVVVLLLPGPGVATVESTGLAGACNGSRALCTRRLDQVVFPATHNSYSAADEPGWYFANQRRGIARQLRDGIRAFLIDIHYGAPDPGSGRIRTDLQAEGSSQNKVARELSPRALATAERLVGRAGVGQAEGDPRPYLCHTLCELGAEPLDEQLRLFADFLDANPRDVIVLFVEPYVPVKEIEQGLRATGLLDQAATMRSDRPLPTLGRLIRGRTRLVVLAEQDGGARPWYLPGFSFAQDTPLGATAGSELRCDRFRGEPDSPLLLVNHWIDSFPPSPSRNERIGGAFLERRLERCERERGRPPNLVAVDFYENSDVVEIARDMNAR